MIRKGIDISKWNKTVDLQLAKQSGVEFVIVRAGFGKNNQDAYAHKNAVSANAIKVPLGIYWFSYATSIEEARKEGKYAVNFARNHLVELPIYFDFEYDSVKYLKKKGYSFNKETYCSFVESFCRSVEEEKYYAGFYCNKDYLRNYVSAEILSKYDLWLADYTNTIPSGTSFKQAHMQQYSSKGIVKGIDGYVDLNATDRDYPAIIRKAGLNQLH